MLTLSIHDRTTPWARLVLGAPETLDGVAVAMEALAILAYLHSNVVLTATLCVDEHSIPLSVRGGDATPALRQIHDQLAQWCPSDLVRGEQAAVAVRSDRTVPSVGGTLDLTPTLSQLAQWARSGGRDVD
jgi:hypothetical protein